MARVAAGKAAGQEVDVEELARLKGKPALYHCVSRVVDRRYVFGREEKEQFVRYMRLYERFCQVRVLAYTVMSNHFHILLEVPSPPAGQGRDWTDEKLLRHLHCLYSEQRIREIRWQLAEYRRQGNIAAAEALRESFLVRMWDLSQFMKTVKQRFARWFNTRHGRKGTLWEERFKSTLVESGRAARAVAGYIDLNPVRAGLVTVPERYRWSSFGEAVRGVPRAREGLQRVLFERERGHAGPEAEAAILRDWRRAAHLYREILAADLARKGPDSAASGQPAGGRAVRVRHYVDGLAIGTRRFLDGLFALTRERFGPRRRTGARPIRGLAGRCSMRDLQSRGGGGTAGSVLVTRTPQSPPCLCRLRWRRTGDAPRRSWSSG